MSPSLNKVWLIDWLIDWLIPAYIVPYVPFPHSAWRGNWFNQTGLSSVETKDLKFAFWILRVWQPEKSGTSLYHFHRDQHGERPSLYLWTGRKWRIDILWWWTTHCLEMEEPPQDSCSNLESCLRIGICSQIQFWQVW